MPDQEHRRPPTRRRKKEPLLPILVSFVILVLAVTAGTMYFFSGPEQQEQPEEQQQGAADPRPRLEATAPQPDAGQGSPAPAMSESRKPPAASPGETPVQPEGMPVPAMEGAEKAETHNTCSQLAGQLQSFFSHIDSQQYIEPFALQEPSQAYFIAMAERLLDNPPVVARESDDLYTILKNMAHFFRVIGKDNIILIKTILDRERDKIEDVAHLLYRWIVSDRCSSDQFSFDPSLSEVYEYAGFFLNTMGGRSYLFRRDSRSRLLVNYYSILLVDRANEEGINRHGIDISEIIPQLIEEIRSSNQLIYKENYLDRLYDLMEEYPPAADVVQPVPPPDIP